MPPLPSPDPRAFLERKAAQRQDHLAQLRLALRAAAVELAGLLAADFGVGRVWLFGSLVWGRPDERSDIDLAVEGLPPERFIEALAALMQAAPTSIDLLRLEEAPAALRARILASGELCCMTASTTPTAAWRARWSASRAPLKAARCRVPVGRPICLIEWSCRSRERAVALHDASPTIQADLRPFLAALSA